jgi:hypothetical protein
MVAALAAVAVAPPASGAEWSAPAALDTPPQTDQKAVGITVDGRGRAAATTIVARGGTGCRGRCGGHVAMEPSGALSVPALAAPPAPFGGGGAAYLRERQLANSRVELAVALGSADDGPGRFRRLERYDAWQFGTRARIVAGASGHVAVGWIAERKGGGGPLRAVVRLPGGDFGPRVTVSRRSVNVVSVAVSPRGDVLIAYQRAGRIVSRVRPAGATRFGAADDVGPGSRATGAQMATATDSGGRLLVAWLATRAGSARGTLRMAVRPRRAARFAAPTVVTRAATSVGTPLAALGRDGTVTVGWNEESRDRFADAIGRLAVAPRDGRFRRQAVPDGRLSALATSDDGTAVALVSGAGALRALVKRAGTAAFGEPELVAAQADAVAAALAFAPDGRAVAGWRTVGGGVSISRRAG